MVFSPSVRVRRVVVGAPGFRVDLLPPRDSTARSRPATRRPCWNLCAQTPSIRQYCDGITRLPSAATSITLTNFLDNLGSIKTDGWRHRRVTGRCRKWSSGHFKVDLAEHLRQRLRSCRRRRPATAAGQSASRSTTARSRSGPRTPRSDWTRNNWSAAWTVAPHQRLVEEPAAMCRLPMRRAALSGDAVNTLGSTTYNDAQVGWKFDWLEGLQLTVGVNNVFGEDPPVCLSCSLNGYDARPMTCRVAASGTSAPTCASNQSTNQSIMRPIVIRHGRWFAPAVFFRGAPTIAPREAPRSARSAIAGTSSSSDSARWSDCAAGMRACVVMGAGRRRPGCGRSRAAGASSGTSARRATAAAGACGGTALAISGRSIVAVEIAHQHRVRMVVQQFGDEGQLRGARAARPATGARRR